LPLRLTAGRARANERWFLNLPDFRGGAYVVAYGEDTSVRGLLHCDDCREPENFEPRAILEAVRPRRAGA